jgi:microcystin-dependent protein
MQCPTSAGGSQLVSRATFAALFVALGTTWGAGDGSTTFGIPWFPSGYGGVHNTSGVSTQTTGSVISHTHTTAAAAANLGTESATHTHSFNPTNSGSASGTSYYGAYTGIPDGTGQTGTQSADHTHYDAGHAHSVNATGGTANVPAGVQLMFCVKY